MMNMANMMKQFNQMQKKLQTAQNELKEQEITSSVANGAIEITFDGQCKFKCLKLKKEAINPENPEKVDDDTVEMLEDLLTKCLKDVTNKANGVFENKMKSLTGGINIPGLF